MVVVQRRQTGGHCGGAGIGIGGGGGGGGGAQHDGWHRGAQEGAQLAPHGLPGEANTVVLTATLLTSDIFLYRKTNEIGELKGDEPVRE